MGFDFTVIAISLWLLLCLWMWGVFFGEFQCLPVDDCPAASCDSGVLARGSESTSFYSAILVPGPRQFLYHSKAPDSRCSLASWILVKGRPG